MSPLPSFTVTGNLNDILPTPTSGAITTEAWTSARIVFTHNINSSVLVWEDKIYDRPPTINVVADTGGDIGTLTDPVVLLANDSGLNVTGIQWHVQILNPTSSTIAAFWFNAPAAGGTVDLGTVIPAPNAPATGVTTISSAEIADATTIGKEILTAPNAATAMGYLTVNDAFNWQASNTRRLQRSMGFALAGPGFSDHLFIGDSETCSFLGSGTNYAAMWPRIMRTLLNDHGIPLGGTGWVFAAEDSTSTLDPRWSLTGSWSAGYGFMYINSATATATFTSDIPGTAIQLAYFNVGAVFTVSVDGGTPVTVTPNGAGTVSTYTVTGLANTVHTVTIACTTSAAATFVVAAQCYGGSGVRLHNAALGGTKATVDWTTTEFTTYSGGNRAYVTLALVPNPDVIHVALGVNDIGSSVAISSVITALTGIRNTFPNADCILYGQYQPSGATAWPAYILALYQLAVTLNCPLIDLYQRSGGYTAANGYGMMGDTIHPNAAGQADWGRLVTNLLMKAI